jgi:hypothetical protein
MSLQAFKSMLCVPERPYTPSTAGGTYGALLLDASGERAAAVFAIPKTGNVRKIGWRTTTVLTGSNMDVRLETVDPANGDPTGTLVGTNTNATQVVNAADDNVFFTTQLTADAAVTVGDILAVVIVQSTGSLSVANCTDDTADFPYCDQFTIPPSTWSKFNSAPVLTLEYDDGTYEPIFGCYPYKNLNVPVFNSPNERGLQISSFPFACRVHGVWFYGDVDGDAAVNIYDPADVLLRTVAFDKDIRRASTSGVQYRPLASTLVLTAGVKYTVALGPTTATNVSLSECEVPSTSAMNAMTLGASALATRNGGGPWITDATKRPFIGVMVDALDDGVGTSIVVPVNNPVWVGNPNYVNSY